MTRIDFVTALARLLRDPAERAAFAQDPEAVAEKFGVRAEDRQAFTRLVPAELEAQARVLIRKRYREAQTHLPATCRALGERAWPLFAEHSGHGWPTTSTADALAFADFLHRRGETVTAAERNRVRFAAGDQKLAVKVTPPVRGWTTYGLQVLLRRRARIVEWSVCLGL